MKRVWTMVAILLTGSCNYSRRHATEQMSWSVESRDYPLRPLPANTIRLTFEGAPSFHAVVTDVPDIVEHLQSAGRPIVPVEFEVACRLWGKEVIWYRVERVDGHTVPAQSGGWAESVGGRRGPEPIATVCP
jgi:hypothetical protein